MTSQKLALARAYEAEAGEKIAGADRPKFHLSPRAGWMNDPNGFSFYNGEYHLFYQYYPYKSVWDSMHWGHAVSRDLLHWNYLPAAMAPDEEYDSFGCFSGSAIDLPDGRQLLLYTGVRKEDGDDVQTQCVAIGDGLNYEKCAANPVIDTSALPEGKSQKDFRDPKIWRESDGTYRCVVGTCDGDRRGCILLFSSADGVQWKYESILAENDGRFGTMWECPDFFSLDGKHVLLCSPQDMLAEGYEYHNGSGTLCLIGTLSADGKKFSPEHDQPIDQGIDFYAPQTTLMPDGRRVMIGWLQNWDTCALTGAGSRPWFGQMSVPREIEIRDGWLYQKPVRELECCRSNRVSYENIRFAGEMTLAGIEGRTVDLTVTLRAANAEKLYQKFAVRFAQNGTLHSAVSFHPHESLVKLDRKFSGIRKDCIHQRRCHVSGKPGEVKLHLILDRFSAELFINDGERTMSVAIWTEAAARGITFFADGEVSMDVTKYDLLDGE